MKNVAGHFEPEIPPNFFPFVVVQVYLFFLSLSPCSVKPFNSSRCRSRWNPFFFTLWPTFLFDRREFPPTSPPSFKTRFLSEIALFLLSFGVFSFPFFSLDSLPFFCFLALF